MTMTSGPPAVRPSSAGQRPLHGNGEEHAAQTRDVSARGICFYVDSGIQAGSAIDFTLTLPPEITLTESIRVRCKGRVVRVEGRRSRRQDGGRGRHRRVRIPGRCPDRLARFFPGRPSDMVVFILEGPGERLTARTLAIRSLTVSHPSSCRVVPRFLRGSADSEF